MIVESAFCRQPDRDNPKLTCGHPLPCPYHTAVIDVANETVTAPFILDFRRYNKLGPIGEAMVRALRKERKKNGKSKATKYPRS